MRTIRTLLAVFFGLFIVGGVATALAAAYARGRVEPLGGEDDDEFDLVSIYDNREFASRARALRRWSALSWFGGGTVDLRGATLDPAGATATTRSIFGGLRLVVPETWRVENNTLAIIGGVGDARSAQAIDESRPVLTLDGLAIFGGLAIVSDAPDLDRKAAETAEAQAASEAAAVFQEEMRSPEPAIV